jgi:serine protease Do
MKRVSLFKRLLAIPVLGVAVATGALIADGPDANGLDANGGSNKSSQPVVSEQTLGIANSLSEGFRDVSNHVLPAVVAIENRPDTTPQKTQPTTGEDPFGGNNPFKGTPFEDMFRGHNFGSPTPSPRKQAGIGSGVIIDPAGVILTNNHVVDGAGKVIVRIHDGREFVATEVLTDPQTDIAVIKIKTDDALPFAKLADSDAAQVGDWVVALGQPFGLESTVTAGIISAKNRGIGITDRENFIQTDAAINPGNSGGPLVNLRGEIVGINTAISSRTGGNNGIGFAVPSNLAGWVKDQLLSNGKVQRSYLGVAIQPVSYELASQLGVPARGGVAVTDVFPDTPAAKAGLQTGDVIVKFGGTAVSTPQQLQLVVERTPVGEKTTVEVVRDGKTIDLSYEPATAPDDFGVASKRSSSSQEDSGAKLNMFGIELSELTDEIAKQLGMENQRGVVITAVQDDSPAKQAGLEAGMLITQVNRQAVTTPEEFAAVVKADEDGSILLLVRTENGSRFVVLEK